MVQVGQDRAAGVSPPCPPPPCSQDLLHKLGLLQAFPYLRQGLSGEKLEAATQNPGEARGAGWWEGIVHVAVGPCHAHVGGRIRGSPSGEKERRPWRRAWVRHQGGGRGVISASVRRATHMRAGPVGGGLGVARGR